jgi:hypothetical protein
MTRSTVASGRRSYRPHRIRRLPQIAGLVAVVALLTLAFGSSTVLAGRSAGGGADIAFQPNTMAIGVAPDPGRAERRLDADDDGEDHFDEGDDEFGGDESDESDESGGGAEAGCRDYDDGEDRCLDGRHDGGDRSDAGDDESSCDNYNDGEDRCEDNPDDRLDAGDDEFDASCPSGAAPVGSADDGEDHFDEGDDEYQAGPCVVDSFDSDLDAGAIQAAGAVAPTPSAAPLPVAATSNSADATLPIAVLGVGAVSAAGLLLARRRLGA